VSLVRWEPFTPRPIKVSDFTVDDEASDYRLQLKKMVDGDPNWSLKPGALALSDGNYAP
jgi:hypothetical protein